jgi:hypothetical protein
VAAGFAALVLVTVISVMTRVLRVGGKWLRLLKKTANDDAVGFN